MGRRAWPTLGAAARWGLLSMLALMLARESRAQAPPCSGSNCTSPPSYPTASYLALMQNTIVNADIWDERPMIITANYVFEGIEGVVNGNQEQYARAAGGTWNQVPERCANVTAVRTTVNTPQAIAVAWGYPVYSHANGMPVVFSWPVLTSTVTAQHFLITLSNGSSIHPEVASVMPNLEPNERHVIVLFGGFGNRLDPSQPGALWTTRVQIVAVGGQHMMLLGPNGTAVPATGLSYNASCCVPYADNGVGPRLVAAKLSRASSAGEATAAMNPAVFPNDCKTLYNDTQYRLRLYTSGGFSPDGVRGVYPTDYQTFFRIHVRQGRGRPLYLIRPNVEYHVPGKGIIRVLGLADLGLKQDTYDECYKEDHDNYIDICLAGSRDAMAQITGVEMPAGNRTADPYGRYRPMYNPGGPGKDPTPGVKYTHPSAWQLQAVTVALREPGTVTLRPAGGGNSTTNGTGTDDGRK